MNGDNLKVPLDALTLPGLSLHVTMRELALLLHTNGNLCYAGQGDQATVYAANEAEFKTTADQLQCFRSKVRRKHLEPDAH